MFVVHDIQRGHLRWGGQAVGVSVEAAVGVGGLPEGPDAREHGAVGREAPANPGRRVVVFVKRVAKPSRVILVRAW